MSASSSRARERQGKSRKSPKSSSREFIGFQAERDAAWDVAAIFDSWQRGDQIGIAVEVPARTGKHSQLENPWIMRQGKVWRFDHYVHSCDDHHLVVIGDILPVADPVEAVVATLCSLQLRYHLYPETVKVIGDALAVVTRAKPAGEDSSADHGESNGAAEVQS